MYGCLNSCVAGQIPSSHNVTLFDYSCKLEVI